jgi:hypothetical protein
LTITSPDVELDEPLDELPEELPVELPEDELPQAVMATRAVARSPATHQRFSIALSPFAIVF